MASRKISAQEYTAIEDTGVSYNKKDVLGRGAFGTVFSGIFQGNQVAIKRMDSTKCDDDREVHLQRALEHVNILRVLAVVTDDDFRYIALELCAGTLDQYIDKNKEYKGPNLPPDRIVLYEIANGLHYIHSKNFVHRDIKPENILISMRGEMKLSDFGLSKKTSERGTFSLSGTKGTMLWMAPELLPIYNEFKEVRGTSSSDTFSTGCVFFSFLTRGIHPFGDTYLDVIRNLGKNKPTNVKKLDSKHFATSTVRQMIHHDPLKRVSIEKVKNQFEPEVKKPDESVKNSKILAPPASYPRTPIQVKKADAFVTSSCQPASNSNAVQNSLEKRPLQMQTETAVKFQPTGMCQFTSSSLSLNDNEFKSRFGEVNMKFISPGDSMIRRSTSLREHFDHFDQQLTGMETKVVSISRSTLSSSNDNQVTYKTSFSTSSRVFKS